MTTSSCEPDLGVPSPVRHLITLIADALSLPVPAADPENERLVTCSARWQTSPLPVTSTLWPQGLPTVRCDRAGDRGSGINRSNAGG